MQRSRLVPLLALALLFAAAMPGRAEAKYEFCNKTSYYLFSAIAYESDGALTAHGWWPLRPGECRTVIEEPLAGGRYYTYAESHPAHKGGRQTWGGTYPFCTADGSFNIARDACERGSPNERLFVRVDIGDAKTWTTDFTELDSYTLASARIAGAQRLLRDVGDDPGGVDGTLGNVTRRAIQRAKDNFQIEAPGTVPDALVDALIAQASDQQADFGFRFCNETKFTLWTALAYAEQGILTSRGWFRVQTSECVKVIKDRLPARDFYTYAEAELEDGQIIIWGGDKTLCTSDVRFEI